MVDPFEINTVLNRLRHLQQVRFDLQRYKSGQVLLAASDIQEVIPALEKDEAESQQTLIADLPAMFQLMERWIRNQPDTT